VDLEEVEAYHVATVVGSYLCPIVVATCLVDVDAYPIEVALCSKEEVPSCPLVVD
jgi:hypothetical protein